MHDSAERSLFVSHTPVCPCLGAREIATTGEIERDGDKEKSEKICSRKASIYPEDLEQGSPAGWSSLSIPALLQMKQLHPSPPGASKVEAGGSLWRCALRSKKGRKEAAPLFCTRELREDRIEEGAGERGLGDHV